MIIQLYRIFQYFVAKFELAEGINGTHLLLRGLRNFLIFACITYVSLGAALYFNQEELIFRSHPLSENHKFNFTGNFEEQYFRAADNKILHGVLFKASSSKGLIFYLHGTHGALDTWGNLGSLYNEMKYDLFIMDYRGYGKSQGTIQNEAQFYNDILIVYNKMRERYPENRVIIAGHSLGSAPATWLASFNNPKALLLLKPYYNLTEYGNRRFPLFPESMHRYALTTNKFIRSVKAPIYIFHDNRGTVSYENAAMLQKIMKSSTYFYTLPPQKNKVIDRNEIFIWYFEQIFNVGTSPQYLSNVAIY